jgi:hypothetical protein
MKKVSLVLLALTFGLVAFAGKPADAGKGGQCVQAGIEVLRGLEAFVPAAQQQVDYSAFAGPDGIRLPLEKGSNLSLGTVISLHATNPGVFAWCDETSSARR